MSQDCPVCGLTNPPVAQRCDCGYDFKLGKVSKSYLTPKDILQRAREAQAQQEADAALGIVGGRYGVRLLVRFLRLFSR
jgi:hypothetical protein